MAGHGRVRKFGLRRREIFSKLSMCKLCKVGTENYSAEPYKIYG